MLFVVHRHHATTRHYDLRLEVDGVLASWAVPKVPSLDPQVKRLAMRVDDHDLDHADVEGTEHGSKIIWDRGGYDADAPAAALAAGHLRFVLHGEKLAGGFVLQHTRMGGHDRNWLLLKVDGEHADPGRDLALEEASVVSGLTNADLEAGSES
ncbi:DNA polymerase ligase N-terminal domain-containing protein [Nocardioides sp. SYSU D00038]|uniref:DNA polymerase ligase N-terminal domain-containing protein n=1 Tax=Nocardioides sp. SYSU D00038 TaxID=2812554 RepID=UPI0019671F8D|nr:DNA polymerase ligase N-terminal domain-containing protein [Nocardioides sp. SYSU D00038]